MKISWVEWVFLNFLNVRSRPFWSRDLDDFREGQGINWFIVAWFVCLFVVMLSANL